MREYRFFPMTFDIAESSFGLVSASNSKLFSTYALTLAHPWGETRYLPVAAINATATPIQCLFSCDLTELLLTDQE